jgi:hypothetical protein
MPQRDFLSEVISAVVVIVACDQADAFANQLADTLAPAGQVGEGGAPPEGAK